MSGAKFGSLDGGVELNACPPARNVESLIGRMKGIQGFRNSCYLDATLYAMFVQSTAFDRSASIFNSFFLIFHDALFMLIKW